MATFILKLMDENLGIGYYFEWSTLTSAPISYGMELDEFGEYFRKVYGEERMPEFAERIKRVETKGTSTIQFDLATILKTNRAGENGACISKEEILDRYSKHNIHGSSDDWN